ncbi:MAG: PAS domain S-box protein [Bacteroidota bacterium]
MKARDGFYPGDIETDVSEERLRRFFEKEDGGYRVRRELRELVVFAPHNLLSDPPFSRIDLISCRNMLIYLQRGVQRNVSDVFHYALRPGGRLLVGTSETIEKSDLFWLESKPLHIYHKRDVPAPEPRLPVFPLSQVTRTDDRMQRDHVNEPVPYGRLHQRMVERYGPPSMLVNPEDRVVHLSEHAGRYLEMPGGLPTTSAFKLVREEFRVELRAILYGARSKQQPVRSKPTKVRIEGTVREVVLDVRPALDPQQQGFVLVLFDERAEQDTQTEEPEQASPANVAGRVRELEAELTRSRQRLQAIIEEYETTQEEMKASNEELQSSNEELRSTMEELETSKEELQSLNEELQTVNQENRHRVEELRQLSGDLKNLLSSTGIATLFLDRTGRIMRFTPRATEIFNIRPTDRGRPVSDITQRVGYGELADDARQVLERLTPVEREVQDEEGRSYLTRVLPYRSTEDRIEGVVITFVDITERKAAEDALAKEKVYAENIVEALHEPLLVLTSDLRVRSANQAFYDHFNVRREETEGRRIYQLGNGQWDIPQFRTLLEDVLPDSRVFNDFEVRHTFDDIGERVMLLNARRLDHVQLILLGIRDITEKKQAKDAVRASEERQQFALDSAELGTFIWDIREDRPDHDQRSLSLFGVEHSEDLRLQTALAERLHPEDRQRYADAVGRALDPTGSGRFQEDVRVLLKDDTVRWINVSGQVSFAGEPREAVSMAGVVLDVTERYRAEAALRESEAQFRAVADLVPDLLWRGDPGGSTTWFNRRWMAYTGQTLEEAAGWGWAEAIHPDDRERSQAQYMRAVENAESFELEHRMRRHDGVFRWFLVRAEPVCDEDNVVRHWFGSATDIHEQRAARETLEQRVAKQTQQIREMARRLTLAEQNERRRISQILHDDLQQLLYGIHMKLSMVVRDLGAASDATKLADDINEAQKWLDAAVRTTRELTVDLSPPILKSEGLADALEWLQRQMEELHGLRVDLSTEHSFRMLDESLRVLLFQIVRELLFNIKKHAEVDRATIGLIQDDDAVAITVQDEGGGFDLSAGIAAQKERGGFGLYSARERLRLVGGSLEIRSAPGEGTYIVIRCPYRRAEREEHEREMAGR